MDICILLMLLSIGVVRRLDASDLDEWCFSLADCPKIERVECRARWPGRPQLTCQCAAGFMQNSTREYTKQECVPTVAQVKPHGVACTWGECGEQYVCKNGVCACPAQRPVFKPMNRKCTFSGYDGSCYDTAFHLEENRKNGLVYAPSSCWQGAICVEDFCVCPKDLRPNWHPPTSRCDAPYAGQRCSPERYSRCHESGYPPSHLRCDADENCVCDYGFPVWNLEERRCVRRPLGHTCPLNTPFHECVVSTVCVDGTCQCHPATPLPDPVTKTCSEKAKFGQRCTVGNCEPNDLSCQDSICKCNDTSLEFNGVACVSRTKKSFEERCGGEDICNGERGLVCEKSGSCKCGAGRTWRENLCQEIVNECKNEHECEASKGLHCDIEAGLCLCPEGKQVSKSGSCMLAVGQPCYDNRVLRHDLCASDLCIGQNTTTAALAGRCACADFNGVKYTWSSEPDQGCVLDYFGLPCNPSIENRDCRRIENVRPEDALSCLEMNGGWFCACSEGKTHFQAFCVVASLSRGEICDPQGAGPTCSLDPAKGLVCDNSGSGPFTCQCQKRALTSGDGTVEYGSTTWNNATKGCELRDDIKSGGGVLRRSTATLLVSLYRLIY